MRCLLSWRRPLDCTKATELHGSSPSCLQIFASSNVRVQFAVCWRNIGLYLTLSQSQTFVRYERGGASWKLVGYIPGRLCPKKSLPTLDPRYE